MSNWLHISPTSGNTNTRMGITADTNDTGEIRRATIVVTAGTMSKTIDVVQYPSNGNIAECTYIVAANNTLKLVDYYPHAWQGITWGIVYDKWGNSIMIDDEDITNYVSLNPLDVVEGEEVHVSLSGNWNRFCPNQFNNVTVKTIEFKEGIDFDNRFTNIGSFQHLPYLERVYFPSSFTTYGENENNALFIDCPALKSFEGESSFIYDSRTLSRSGYLFGVALQGLEEYVVPSVVDRINFGTFALTTGTTAIAQPTIKSIVITSATTKVDTKNYRKLWSSDPDVPFGFFQDNITLTSVTMPDNIIVSEDLTEMFFNGCVALTSVTIPSSFIRFGEEMLKNCSSLTALTIPETVAHLQGNVFDGCSALTSLTAINKPYISSTTFYNIATGGTLHYPPEIDFSDWLSNNEYYLGYYSWNDGVDFNLENVSTYFLQFAGNASGTNFTQKVYITANKPNYNIVVSSSQSSVITGNSWVNVSGTPSYGRVEYNVYPTSTASTNRTCYIHILYQEEIFGTITVSQVEGEEYFVLTSTDSVSFYADSSSSGVAQTIIVSSNIVYSVTNNNNWVVVSGTPSSGISYLKIYPNSNNTGSSNRTGNVTLWYNNVCYATIGVEQTTQLNPQNVPYINVDPTSLTFTSASTSSSYQYFYASGNSGCTPSLNSEYFTVSLYSTTPRRYRVYPTGPAAWYDKTATIYLQDNSGVTRNSVLVTQQGTGNQPIPVPTNVDFTLTFSTHNNSKMVLTFYKAGAATNLDLYEDGVYSKSVSVENQTDVLIGEGNNKTISGVFTGALNNSLTMRIMEQVQLNSVFLESLYVYDKIYETRINVETSDLTDVYLDFGTLSKLNCILPTISYISGSSPYITSDHRKCIGYSNATYGCWLPSEKYNEETAGYGSWNGQWTWLCYATSGLTEIVVPENILLWGYWANDLKTKNYGIQRFTLPYSPIPFVEFDGWVDLTSVTLNCAFISTTNRMFWGCSGMTSVSLPYIKELSSESFAYSNITSITFQDDVKTVTSYAFYQVAPNGVIHYSSRLNTTSLNAMRNDSYLSSWTFIQDVP